MCYLVRERQAGMAEPGGATVPPSIDRLRPRWAGAIAAALIGGVAVAALVAPSTPPLSTVKDSARAPLVSSAPAVPTATVVEQGSAPVDDGVPTSSDVVKAGLGHCDHGL